MNTTQKAGLIIIVNETAKSILDLYHVFPPESRKEIVGSTVSNAFFAGVGRTKVKSCITDSPAV
jgi:hypothetical protein